MLYSDCSFFHNCIYLQLFYFWLGDTMKREIDFEILAEKINDSDLYEFVAFSNDVPVRAINRDLDSIKEALNSHDKIFLEIGFYGYDDEYCDEPYFMFDANESIDDLKDDYYDKYKFMVGGYGIYLDKDLNVEYGYYRTEAPACGHGAGYTEFYDFKDARDDDIIKEKIYSILDSSGIWK